MDLTFLVQVLIFLILMVILIILLVWFIIYLAEKLNFLNLEEEILEEKSTDKGILEEKNTEKTSHVRKYRKTLPMSSNETEEPKSKHSPENYFQSEEQGSLGFDVKSESFKKSKKKKWQPDLADGTKSDDNNRSNRVEPNGLQSSEPTNNDTQSPV